MQGNIAKFLPVLFAQINQASSSFGGNFSTWRSVAEDYFDNLLNNKGPGYLTGGEFRPLEFCSLSLIRDLNLL